MRRTQAGSREAPRRPTASDTGRFCSRRLCCELRAACARGKGCDDAPSPRNQNVRGHDRIRVQAHPRRLHAGATPSFCNPRAARARQLFRIHQHGNRMCACDLRARRGARARANPCGRARDARATLTRWRARRDIPTSVNDLTLERDLTMRGSDQRARRRSKRYASSGPRSVSYASRATRSANGSRKRAMRSGPASTGSNPVSRTRRAAVRFALASSPQ